MLLFDTSVPFLRGGHNDIFDDQGCFLIYADEVLLEDIDVTFNYWAELDPELLDRRFFPSEKFKYDPYDTEPNTGQHANQGGGGANAQFLQGLSQESTGDFTGAVQTYQTLISNYPDSIEATGSISRLKVCIQNSTQDFQTLQSYYDSLSLTHPGTPLAKNSKPVFYLV